MKTHLQKEFEKKWNEFMDKPFPHVAQDDIAHEFQTKLIEFDAYYAGLVTRIFNGQRVNSKQFKSYRDDDIFSDLAKLKERIGSDREDLIEYEEYLMDLSNLIQLAKSISEEGKR